MAINNVCFACYYTLNVDNYLQEYRLFNIYQLWTFDEVDTLFYGPDRVTLTKNDIRGRYHTISHIEQPIHRIRTP